MDVLVPAISSDVLRLFRSIVRSKLYDDIGGHFLILPSSVLPPDYAEYMLSDFFQHPSSLCVFWLDGLALDRLI